MSLANSLKMKPDLFKLWRRSLLFDFLDIKYHN